MAGPEYDFFATGLRPAPAPSAPAPPTSLGGSSVVPGGAGPELSRFGLPADAVAAPTGPMAAPGYVDAPVPAGIAAWDAPAAGSRMAARHGAAAAPAPNDQRPGAVLAAGIIALVGAVLIAGLGLLGLFGYLALKSQLSQASAAGVEGLETMVDQVLGAMLLGILFLIVLGVGYGFLGAMVVIGRRWAAWTLLVLSALGLAGSLYGGLQEGDLLSLTRLIQLAVPTALVLLLTMGDGGRWLRRS